VAGQRELAPPSKFSKLGGFRNKVFITDGIYMHPHAHGMERPHSKDTNRKTIVLDFAGQQ